MSLPPWVRVSAAVLIVAAGLLSVVGREFRVTKDELSRNDFTQDYISAKAWMDGANPYDRIETLSRRYLGPNATPGIGAGRYNPHPPVSILLTAPLALLPYRVARALWLLLTAAAIAAGVGLVARRVGLSLAASVVTGVGALALPVSQRHLQLVQSEGIVLLLLAFAWVQLDRKEGWAGSAIGVAAAFRLFPALMLIPLLRMRKFRAAMSTVVVAALVTIVTSLVVGLSNVHHLVTTASPDNFKVWAPSPQNLSMLGVPFQWLTKSLWHPHQVNVPWLSCVIALLILGVGVLAMIRTPFRLSGDPYWAVIPLMLLVEPLTPEYLLILMFPVVIVSIYRLHIAREPIGIPLMLAMTISFAGIPPGIQFAAPGVSVIKTLPYLVPTAALLFLVISDWRRRPMMDAAEQPHTLS